MDLFKIFRKKKNEFQLTRKQARELLKDANTQSRGITRSVGVRGDKER